MTRYIFLHIMLTTNKNLEICILNVKMMYTSALNGDYYPEDSRYMPLTTDSPTQIIPDKLKDFRIKTDKPHYLL